MCGFIKLECGVKRWYSTCPVQTVDDEGVVGMPGCAVPAAETAHAAVPVGQTPPCGRTNPLPCSAHF